LGFCLGFPQGSLVNKEEWVKQLKGIGYIAISDIPGAHLYR
jgi:hypothetical protein